MFKPRYQITTQLLENIKRISVHIANLNGRHFSKLTLVKLERSAREVSTHSSTSIEGNPLPLTEVKKIIKNQPRNLRDSEREVVNYNQALELLEKGIEKESLCFDVKLIQDTQKIVTDGLIQPYNSGQIRQQPVFVNDPRVGKPVYLPPDYQDVPKLLKELVDFVHNNKNVLDPLIVAGIFHKQFVLIHPFTDGNGRTARLMTKVLLANLGINTFNLFSFENYYNQNVSKYFENVGALGNYYELTDDFDFTQWLEYFSGGIIDELLRVEKLLQQEQATPDNTLKQEHKDIVAYIKKHGFITDRDYAQITDRAKPTRNQDFNKLIELGLIARLGKGKATYYKLKDA